VWNWCNASNATQFSTYALEELELVLVFLVLIIVSTETFNLTFNLDFQVSFGFGRKVSAPAVEQVGALRNDERASSGTRCQCYDFKNIFAQF
jgi:hypothetical protein